MIFQDLVNIQNSIVNKVLRLARTDLTDYPLRDIAQDCNTALNEIVSECVIPYDERFKMDDYNHTGLPIRELNLVAGTREYQFRDDGSGNDILTFNQVSIIDVNGETIILDPVSQHDQFINDERSIGPVTQNSVPYYYTKLKDSIILNVKPNWSSTNGVKLLMSRAPSFWLGDNSGGDNSKAPGFVSVFHDLIPLIAAREYALAEGKDNLKSLDTRTIERKQVMIAWVRQRAEDSNPQIVPYMEDNE